MLANFNELHSIQSDLAASTFSNTSNQSVTFWLIFYKERCKYLFAAEKWSIPEVCPFTGPSIFEPFNVK
jgi:hypothetical protein